jgi:hypothetical protein
MMVGYALLQAFANELAFEAELPDNKKHVVQEL